MFLQGPLHEIVIHSIFSLFFFGGGGVVWGGNGES